MNTSRFGRARFGGGPVTLLLTTLLLGLVLAALIGALGTVINSQDSTWLVASVFALTSLPVTLALTWVLLVDRSTLTGALDNPEDSVESHWLNRAARGAFFDIMTVAGLGIIAFLLAESLGWSLNGSGTLLLLLLLGWFDFGLRYWVQQRGLGDG
ncbi:hypothetical protein [Corynebacterium nasicanis]|uniref:Uncharacterized protein n=1 Tax=Corynebacterium nasicanis TaxID=1448267 RepID=A0ABW1QF34_9CORY